jgi:hypothetical protein
MRRWVLPLWLSVGNISRDLEKMMTYGEDSDGADGTSHHDEEGAAK